MAAITDDDELYLNRVAERWRVALVWRDRWGGFRSPSQSYRPLFRQLRSETIPDTTKAPCRLARRGPTGAQREARTAEAVMPIRNTCARSVTRDG